MCDFGITEGLALAGTLAAAGSATVAYIGQQQQASNQTAIQKATVNNAEASYRDQTAAISQQFMQKRNQLTQDSFNRDVQAEQAKGQAITAGAQSGASGVSLDNVIGDLDAQRGRSAAADQYNLQVDSNDASVEQQNAYSQMVDRTNSVPGGIAPSFLSPVLQTVGAGLSNYSTYMYPKPSIPTMGSASASSAGVFSGGSNPGEESGFA